MGVEDDILKDTDLSKNEEETNEDFEDNVKLTASDIQKSRQDRQQRELRRRNLANNPADKLKRHAIIRKLIETNQAGNDKPSEVHKALEEHGVNVSLVTVCKDLREITNITPQTMKKVDSTLTGILENYLDTLNDIATNSENDETRIRAINAAFDDVRKLYDIMDAIANRTILEETEKAKLRSIASPINEIIQFIDSPERVNKEIYYKDERDKVIEWLQEKIGSMIEKDGKMYQTFSNQTAYNTFIKATDDILEIIRGLKNSPHRNKEVQQENEHKDNSIKMDK